MKWSLRSERETLSGRLVAAQIYAWDGDQNIYIVPDTLFQHLLINRHGQINAPSEDRPRSPPEIECEVEILDRYEKDYLAGVRDLIGCTVNAAGVWVDDDGHDGKTELHPLDALWGVLPRKKWPAWTRQLRPLLGERLRKARRVKKPGAAAMQVYRLVAGSDDSFARHAPLTDQTRAVEVVLEFPPKPAAGWRPKWRPSFKVRHNMSFTDQLVASATKAVLKLTLTAKSYLDGGPGVLVGEIATFWTPPKP